MSHLRRRDVCGRCRLNLVHELRCRHIFGLLGRYVFINLCYVPGGDLRDRHGRDGVHDLRRREVLYRHRRVVVNNVHVLPRRHLRRHGWLHQLHELRCGQVPSWRGS